jgi:hypothetical protein
VWGRVKCQREANRGGGTDGPQDPTAEADFRRHPDRAGQRLPRLRLRHWLLAELSAHKAALTGGDARAADAARRMLRHWRQDADLAAVRAAEHLAELPEGERAAWRNLWALVDLFLVRPLAR